MKLFCDKKSARDYIAEQKRLVDAQWRLTTSLRITEKISTLPEFDQAEYILIYHALWDEVRTQDFIERWYNKKKIVLPVVDGDDLQLRLYIPDDMKEGSFSIMEPTQSPIIDPEQIGLAIIPGVAFDKTLNRLGRGKGFYDRILPSIKASKIGICFDYQFLNNIPCELHDIAMDGVITESRIILNTNKVLL